MKNKKLISIIIAILVVIGIGAYAIHAHNKATELEGTYSAKITVLFVTEDTKIKFSKNKTYSDGDDSSNKGTYQIDGDKLTLKSDDKNSATLTAKLSKDHKSFTITSVSGKESLAEDITDSMIKGLKFTKKE